MYKGCINMLKKRNKKGFTLVELLAVIVILAVVILIAVTAVIPRMNNAKKKALVDEALMYLKAAKESIVFDGDQSPSCINVSNLNEKYIKKSSDSYTGVVKNEYINGELSQTINLTNGNLYIVGTDNLTSSDVKSTIPKGFAASCGDYNPILAENADTNTLSYKLLMSEGASTIDANLNTINQRTSTVDFTVAEDNQSKSGLYKAEDDDGASFYYRGIVNNNWVEFGGFYWRVVRINGNGSIRLIYSGLKNSTHTGNDAVILTSNNTYLTPYGDTSSHTTETKDISGLTNTNITTTYSNGRFGNTYVGYMYNPTKVLSTYPNKEVSSSSTNNLNNFIGFKLINNNKQYYFFKDFDVNTNCKLGSNQDESGTCTLVCRELGVDCIQSNYNTMATTQGNYSTTADGVTTNPINYVFTGDFKYTCWDFSTEVTKANSDGTTSVYMSCPLVSEIVGTVKDNATTSKIKFHGLFSASHESSIENVRDSNAKKEVDLWYQNNILNKNDGKQTPSSLEQYLSDEIFCNDRSPFSTVFPINNTSSYVYYPYRRVSNIYAPTLKCSNLSNDGFTLSANSQSIVSSSNKGNNLLKYPVGLITVDELSYAGAVNNLQNPNMYLNVNKTYWTMSPFHFYFNGVAYVSFMFNTGSMAYGSNTTGGYSIRPVINLKASVLYDSGSGTEADPYKVKLSL